MNCDYKANRVTVKAEMCRHSYCISPDRIRTPPPPTPVVLTLPHIRICMTRHQHQKPKKMHAAFENSAQLWVLKLQFFKGACSFQKLYAKIFNICAQL